MANKQALRELQSRLADRLQAARTQARGQSWLAVECSGRGFLLPLREAGEIFALAPILPVPHSHRWFAGVANLRGHLHGVVDLAGLRSDEEVAVEADDGVQRPAFVGARYHDAAGRPWQELLLAELANDEAFLKIVG